MDNIPIIPALRFGERFVSVGQTPVPCLGSQKTLAQLGLVVDGMIGRDVLNLGLLARGRKMLREIPAKDRIRWSVDAARIFEKEKLDCGGIQQTPDDYHDLVSRTSGLPLAMMRTNTKRLCDALRETETIMDGLSGGLSLGVLDKGYGRHNGVQVRFRQRADGLGCNMPNNSPAVNVLWLPALPFGFPILLRPGSAEPFTPYRLIQAHIKAGYPAEAFGYYPCGYGAAARIPKLTKAAIVFGRDETVKQWEGDPMVQLHGAGYSKAVIGEDRIEGWRKLIPELAKNVATNSGRSCFTVSTIIVPKYRNEIAAALAEELAKQYFPRERNDAEANLSAMAMPAGAVYSNETIDAGLKTGGADDMSAKHQPNGRLVIVDGRTYMLPTVVACDSLGHELANSEFLFPYTSVVEMPNEEALAKMGPTLSLAVYTGNQGLVDLALNSHASMVNINECTSVLDRRQPHEGSNLFSDLLYQQLGGVTR